MWNVELTRKKVPSTRTTDGSGAKPGMMGLTVVVAMEIEVKNRRHVILEHELSVTKTQ